ncbi:MAG: hypothetical protein B6242_12075 [Anaerolineaceae bacterium 4572_78]|nr:MAG: hypothetical protein B6242_12075 [Anaerolineaceae bacterium 4572_78]
MTQYWGPPTNPNYPRQQTPYPQIPPPDFDYYNQSRGDSLWQRFLIFVAGGCFALLLYTCCLSTLVIAWVAEGILNEDTVSVSSTAIVAPIPAIQYTTTPTVAVIIVPPHATPPITERPSNQLFQIGEKITDETTSIELIALDIQRHVHPNNVPPLEKWEFVSISVQLRLIDPAKSPKEYNRENFVLQNIQNTYFKPHPEAHNGRRLPNGELKNNDFVEGDVIFQVPEGDNPLYLIWQATGGERNYVIILQ